MVGMGRGFLIIHTCDADTFAIQLSGGTAHKRVFCPHASASH
jgi:hypothetical protein